MEKEYFRRREREQRTEDSGEACNSENYVLKEPKSVFENCLTSSIRIEP